MKTAYTNRVNPILDKSDMQIAVGSVFDVSNEPGASVVETLHECTIMVTYESTSNNSIQSLISVGNSTIGNGDRHFHLYITPEGKLGFELRNTDTEFKYTLDRPASVRMQYKCQPAENSVAFTMNPVSSEYHIFANGELIESLVVADYKSFADILGVDNLSVGGTLRNGEVAYDFSGTVFNLKIYDTVLSESEILATTAVSAKGVKIFHDKQNIISNYFRIPGIITLSNENIAATIDARFGGTHDAPNNIDIGFSKSTDGGLSWTDPVLALKFSDYADQAIDWPRNVGDRDLQIKGSAAFIDSVIVEDTTRGRIFVFADAMPAGVGSGSAAVGSGYKEIDGIRYLKLRYQDETEYNYTIREQGVIYDDRVNEPTQYSVNENFEILEGETLLVNSQYQVRFENHQLIEEHNDEVVASNVFYKDALFKVYPTAYIVMTFSDNGGETWAPMKILNGMVKDESERLLILGPGRGIQLRYAEHQDRLLVPVYSSNYPGAGVIYSDDYGETWVYAPASEGGAGATAEAQIVELPSGTILMFERTSAGTIAMEKSYDSGETWVEREYIEGMTSTSYGTQVSALLYDGLIDEKLAVMLSAPQSTTGRRDGQLMVGLIDDQGGSISIDWKYAYHIDGVEVGYSYSCLTQLPNGHIGIFYEKYDSWSRNELHLKNIMLFDEYTIEDIIGAPDELE